MTHFYEFDTIMRFYNSGRLANDLSWWPNDGKLALTFALKFELDQSNAWEASRGQTERKFKTCVDLRLRLTVA
jgi:hypothetical protein